MPISAPTDIAGCTAWWDPSDAATRTIATGVSQLADKVGSNHLAQATGSKQPTLAALGYLDGLRFTASSQQWLQTSGSFQWVNASNGRWSAFAVTKTPASLSGVLLIVDGDNEGASRVAQVFRTNNTGTESIAFANPVAAFTDAGASLSTSTDYVLTAVRGASAIELFVDNASGGSTGTTGTPAAMTGPIWLGAHAFGGAGLNWYDGIIGEVALWNAELNSTNLTDLYDYAIAKWFTAPAGSALPLRRSLMVPHHAGRNRPGRW